MLDQAGEERWALEAAAGDRAAFARLIDAQYGRIYGLAWRFLGDRDEAEDLAQDVCITLARQIRSFRGEAKVTTWIYRVVLNAARDRLRRRGARARATQAFAEVDALRRDEAAAQAQDAAWLRAALSSLKPKLQEVAVLVLDEGLNQAEAAQVLGIAEGTVAWRVSEAKKALRKLAQERTQ